MKLMNLQSYSGDLKIGAIGSSINISSMLHPSVMLQSFYVQGSMFFFLGITHQAQCLAQFNNNIAL